VKIAKIEAVTVNCNLAPTNVPEVAANTYYIEKLRVSSLPLHSFDRRFESLTVAFLFDRRSTVN
jgi:hypothetical protein